MAHRSPHLDRLIPPDHLVRLVAELVAADGTEGLGYTAPEGQALDGAGSARGLAAAWLYGLLAGARSPAALEAALQENLPLLWLVGEERVDAAALAAFYTAHHERLVRLFRRLIEVAERMGLGPAVAPLLGLSSGVSAAHRERLLQRAQEIVSGVQWSLGASKPQAGGSLVALPRMPAPLVDPAGRRELLTRLLRELNDRGGAQAVLQEPAPPEEREAEPAREEAVTRENVSAPAVVPPSHAAAAPEPEAGVGHMQDAPVHSQVPTGRSRRLGGALWSILSPEPFFRVTGLLGVAFQRFRHQVGLTILALLSVVLAVGLVTSAGFFSQAVDQAMLNKQLREFTRVTGRPPFSVEVYYFPPPQQPMSLQMAEDVKGFVAQTLGESVALPVSLTGLTVHGGNLRLSPRAGAQYASSSALQDVMLTYIADVEPHLEFAGASPGQASSGGGVPVWMHTSLAAEMGVQPGESFDVELGEHVEPLVVTVAGLWQARDGRDIFWLRDPNESMRQNLLVTRDDYIQRVEPRLVAGTRYVDWHIVLDEGAVVPDQVRQYLSGFELGMREINRYLPDARLIHPQSPMQTFVRQQNTLTLRLLTFNLPAFGFLLYFLVLASVIIVRWQRRELAILISRGTGLSNILTLTFLEQVLAFLVGTPLGIALGMVLARMMGVSTGVFSFQTSTSLPVSVRGLNPLLVLGALLVSLAARLLPTLQAARQSVVQQERENTRPTMAPFWYRYYIDLLLIIPTVYAYRRIGTARTLDVLLQENPQDIFRDPLLVLVPALFVVTAGLLAMRLFPLLMRLADGLAGHLPWVTPYLAARQVGRQSESYINPLLLIIVSLALGIYTYSMVGSLDRWLMDHQYYEVGADLTFAPMPMGGEYDPTNGAAWIPTPDAFETLPGVAQATRVANYKSEVLLQGRSWSAARFVGVDYYDYPAVAWFRSDLAQDSLVGLANRLALQPNGILVSERFLADNGLGVGDSINVRVELAYTVNFESTFTIVGSYRYFPTIDLGADALIGNLDYLFTYMGVPFGHDIWIKLHEGASGRDVLASLEDSLKISFIRGQDTRAMLAEEQSRLEQVGVLGTLSIGLLAAAAMAIIGLLIYGYASIRERSYRFGVLRALGLSKWQAIGQVAAEYVVLAAYGAGAGAGVGAVASKLFMPYFGTVARGPSPLPPLLPVLVGGEIALIAVAFALLTVLLELAVVSVSVRQRLFQLMRMGQ